MHFVRMSYLMCYLLKPVSSSLNLKNQRDKWVFIFSGSDPNLYLVKGVTRIIKKEIPSLALNSTRWNKYIRWKMKISAHLDEYIDFPHGQPQQNARFATTIQKQGIIFFLLAQWLLHMLWKLENGGKLAFETRRIICFVNVCDLITFPGSLQVESNCKVCIEAVFQKGIMDPLAVPEGGLLQPNPVTKQVIPW